MRSTVPTSFGFDDAFTRMVAVDPSFSSIASPCTIDGVDGRLRNIDEHDVFTGARQIAAE